MYKTGINIRREVGYLNIKWTLLMELQPDNADGMFACMGDSGSKLCSKSCCYFYVAGEEFKRKGDGLIGRGFGTFPIKGFDYAP